MNLALKLNKVAPEQFCRPGRSALDQSTMKRLCIDHQRYQRECFAQASIDLKSNYDRIVHTAAALALLRVGISHTKIISMFESIQKMVHRVRTAFGDSNNTYGGDDLGNWENYAQGILQGNASGPSI